MPIPTVGVAEATDTTRAQPASRERRLRMTASARSAVVTVLVLSICAVSLTLLGLTAVVLVTNRVHPFWPAPTYFSLLLSAVAVLFGAIGGLIAARRPSNPVGWLLSVLGLASAVSLFGRAYVAGQLGPNRDVVAASVNLASAVWFLALVGALVLFPNGRLPSGAWRTPVWLLGGMTGCYVIIQTLRPGPFEDFVGVDNPFGISGQFGALFRRIPDEVGAPLIFVWFGLAATSLIVRLRRTHGLQRRQLVLLAPPVILATVALSIMMVDWDIGSWGLMAAFAMLPVAIGIAVLRYGLYDVDFVINRALVYSTLTGVLGLVYWAAVLSLQPLLSPFARGSDLAVGGSTLVVAALFQPVRRRVQIAVDQWFYQHKYAAQLAVATLGPRLQEDVDPDQVAENVVLLAERAFEPERAYLWVPSTDGRWRSHETSTELESGDSLISDLALGGGPVDLTHMDQPSSAVGSLRGIGVDTCQPLVVQGQAVGLLGLGLSGRGRALTADQRQILAGLASQAAPALRMAQLVRLRDTELQDRERMDQELRIAQLIQHTLVSYYPMAPSGWRVSAHYEAARVVGGDFYDVVHLPDGRCGLLIGDVSGKGMPAALVMASALSTLRAVAEAGLAPGAVLEHANASLRKRLPERMFVTCQYMLLDPATGLLRYASAGHCPALVCRSTSVGELTGVGLPLGVESAVTYTEAEARLQPGDSLLLYTDGVVETRSPGGELFGFERLESLARGCQHRASGFTERLLQNLEDHRGEGMLEDDLTLLLVQRG